jgi:hypothetical protein
MVAGGFGRVETGERAGKGEGVAKATFLPTRIPCATLAAVLSILTRSVWRCVVAGGDQV